jgi:coenzyme F420 hydrogenase subunit beta
MNTIARAVKRGLCHGCGICAVVCPTNAIEMRCEDPGIFTPSLDENVCTNCGLCLETCSGKDAFGGDSLLGDVIGVWTGYAVDERIRINGASGGIVSAILIRLLETKTADAAVICGPDKDFPTRGKSFVARTEDEIMFGAKSIYGMTEIGTGLRKALNDKNIKKVIVVGLPCQVASLIRAAELVPKLKSKVFLSIGLMDGKNLYHKATQYAIERQGIRLKDVAEFRYRASGWSRRFTELITKDGERHKLRWQDCPLYAIWNASLMVPRRCLLCNDFAAESADIAVSDAWLPEYQGDEKGYSIVLTHTQRGADLVQSLLDLKCLELKPSDISVIGRSQYCQLDFKKRTVAARATILGMHRWLDGKSIGNLSIEDYLTELLSILKNRIVQIAPALTWQMSSPNSLTSRFERCLLSFVLRLCNRVPHGNSVVWKKQVCFRPDILEKTGEQTQSGN